MIRVTETKPAKVFDHLTDNYAWIAGFDSDGPYCYFALEVANSMGSVHLHLLKWTHTIAKRLKVDLDALKIIAKKKGANCLIASFPDVEDTIWPRFIQKYGFPKPSKVFLSKMEI